ncbi:MAG: hypothetical protein HRT90_11220 [Candidatus Margulisbacteria bacterium]|nr:hypothetical protein [Candidatus Margulisiibacteriota bacterium]
MNKKEMAKKENEGKYFDLFSSLFTKNGNGEINKYTLHNQKEEQEGQTDVTLELNGKKYGLEITRIINSNKKSAEVSENNLILALKQKKVPGLENYYANIVFNNEMKLKLREIPSIVETIVDIFNKHISLITGKKLCITQEKERGKFQQHFKCVIAIDNLPMSIIAIELFECPVSFITKPFCGFISSGQNEINSEIVKKNAKLKRYTKDKDGIWLLIVIEREDMSSTIANDINYNQLTRSKFNRVFILENTHSGHSLQELPIHKAIG